jgi:membrane-bound lytic murein transglycosylase D
VGLSDLRYWNNIYKNTIRVGQKLAIYVDPQKTEYFAKINSMSFAEKQALAGKSVTTNTVAATATPQPTVETEEEYITYTVKDGDTIWDIAKAFDNVSTTEVLALNNISDAGKIKPGQKLKIKKKS